jgi:hypothetical protein
MVNQNVTSQLTYGHTQVPICLIIIWYFRDLTSQHRALNSDLIERCQQRQEVVLVHFRRAPLSVVLFF